MTPPALAPGLPIFWITARSGRTRCCSLQHGARPPPGRRSRSTPSPSPWRRRASAISKRARRGRLSSRRSKRPGPRPRSRRFERGSARRKRPIPWRWASRRRRTAFRFRRRSRPSCLRRSAISSRPCCASARSAKATPNGSSPVYAPPSRGSPPRVVSAGLDDLGTCAWRTDIASMRHETQYSRLFRS